MSTQAKLLKDVPVIDIGADTPVLALDSSGAVGKGTLAALDLFYSLGVTGTVFVSKRSFTGRTMEEAVTVCNGRTTDGWGYIDKATDYLIIELTVDDGTCYLYQKVLKHDGTGATTMPILAKIPGKPWRWSKNVTESNSGGGNILHRHWALPCKLQEERRVA